MEINSTTFKTLLVNHEEKKLFISLNRPEKKNAINPVMTNELLYVLNYANDENDVRVLEISAQGDVFCAGGDLNTMAGEENETIPDMKGTIADVVKKLRNQMIGKMDKNKLIKNLFFSIADKGVKL